MHRTLLFISDLHLSTADLPTVEAFKQFMQTCARGAHGLYVLGDLFEYWIGDDGADTLAEEVAEAFKELVESGTPVYLIHGNRDFLIGETWAKQAKVTLLSEPVCIEHEGQMAVLCHGDTFCTDDVSYQQFRALVRNPDWQAAFLARPLPDRQAEVLRIRMASQAAKQEKSSEIMDVNLDSVFEMLRRFPDHQLIHGHTHRPAHHQYDLDLQHRSRWVLPDWYGGQGGYLQWNEKGITLKETNINKPPI